MSKDQPTSDLYYYLKYKCTGCGAKYGTLPYQCHGYRCNIFIKIKPEYQNLMS